VITTTQLAAFAVASLVLIVIPGPGVLFIVGRALSHGRRTAVATAIGHAAGNYATAALIAVGLGTLLERSATVFWIVKLGGAIYLAYLGVQAYRHRKKLAEALDAAAPPDKGALRAARDGFVVGLTNPKAYILFGAILPQFVHRGAGHVPEQMLLLALVSVSIGMLSDCTWALGASAVRQWFASSPRRYAAVGGAGGLAMIAVAATFAATGRKSLPAR
jgi:threonine/homoserine/homoserine lactone efflux protein